MKQSTFQEYKSNGVECPTCGNAFKSLNGMSVHHTKVHGEPIDTKIQTECAYCGAEIKKHRVHYEESGNNFCNTTCTAKWRAENIEPHNKNTVINECRDCGSEIETNPSTDRQFCNQTCYHEWRRGRFTGEDNWNHKEKVTETCEWCDEQFQRRPSEGKGRFCSYGCMNEWKAHRTGTEHPLWQGGRDWYKAIRTLLGPTGWHTQRKENLGDTCELCGTQTTGENRGLSLHHIIPVLSGGTNAEYNYMSLCEPCHRKTEAFIKQYPEFGPVLVELPL